MRIVLLGPPGSGKGTIAKVISEVYGVPVITTGDMLRAAAARGTSLGRSAKGYMDRGELVPDDLVNKMVSERLAEPDAVKGFVLDGFPRSVKQAEALDSILKESGISLTHVLHVYLEDDAIVRRLGSRRSCPGCGAVFNLLINPPKKPGVCDACGKPLIQRDDDREEVIVNRLQVYREKTQPLLDRYTATGKVRLVRGDLWLGEIPDVVRKVLA